MGTRYRGPLMDSTASGQVEVRLEDVELVFKNARATIACCQVKADALQFVGDEVEGRTIVKRMQHEARVLNMVGAVAPARRREAELLMGECARVWTRIALAEPWSSR
jgi:hypothetical protein